jgi:hypothetical protein
MATINAVSTKGSCQVENTVPRILDDAKLMGKMSGSRVKDPKLGGLRLLDREQHIAGVTLYYRVANPISVLK